MRKRCPLISAPTIERDRTSVVIVNSLHRFLSSSVMVFKLGLYCLGKDVMFVGRNIVLWFKSLSDDLGRIRTDLEGIFGGKIVPKKK